MSRLFTESQLEYKGRRIRIELYPDRNGVTFHAKYFIYEGIKEVATATTNGGFRTIVEADECANEAACQWIDHRQPL